MRECLKINTVNFIWILKLPYSFILEGETNQKFKINEKLYVCFLRSKDSRLIESIQVKLNWHLPELIDEFNMSKIQYEYEKAKIEIGSIINNLCYCLAKELNSNLLNIYNGDDFIVPHNFYIMDEEEKQILYNLNASSSCRVLTNEKIQSLLNDIKDNNKIVPDLIVQSEYFLENGFYDMAIINCHTALEVFLGEFFKNKKPELQIKEEMLKALLKSNKLVEKYLHFSSYLIYRRSLQEENTPLFGSLLFLNSLRNYVAHEGTALTNKKLKGKTNEEIYSIVETLIWDVESAIEWVYSLESKKIKSEQFD